jgi:hypothetical protein
VAAYRSDYKTTNEFVLNNIEGNDLIINVGTCKLLLLGKPNDFILDQSIKWNADALIDEEVTILL